MNTLTSDAILRSVAFTEANRNHGWTVKVTCFCGFFLLFFAAGCIGSAVLLKHNEDVAKSSWPEATGRVRNCRVWSFDPVIKLGTIGADKSYALLCDINYQLAGRTYHSTLHSGFTRSLRTRSQLVDWVARNSPESELTVRIDPVSPHRFVVQSPVPFHHGRNPDDYVYGAVVLGVVGTSLVTIGRKLIRSGW